MNENLKRFLRILSVEISDLEDHIAVLLESTEERHRNHDITEYVWTENSALLRHELHLIQLVHKEIEQMDPASYTDIAELRKAIVGILEQREDLPRAALGLLERKMDKVSLYISEE